MVLIFLLSHLYYGIIEKVFVILNNIYVEFSMEISILRSPEPKRVVQKHFCIDIVVVGIVFCRIDPALAIKIQ